MPHGQHNLRSLINVCENVWLRIKRALQPMPGDINTQNELIAEVNFVTFPPDINTVI
jgi:hypothetical protein